MDTELKPCPFCGEEAGICEANDICFHRDDDGNKIFGGWRCFCPSCAIEQIGYETREEAVSAWNNRSTEHATHRAPVDEKGGGRMTGIERLRELVDGISPITVLCGVTKTSYDREHTEVAGARLRDFLSDIAGQIERETKPKSDAVKYASVSAYDPPSQEDRDAIAWVREHGGLDAVKRRWECLSYYADPVPRSCMEKRLARLQRQIDESHAALRRRREIISELNRRATDLTRENAGRRGTIRELSDRAAQQSDEIRVMRDVIAETCARLGVKGTGSTVDDAQVIWREISRRLMPEGMEWPRFESGEPVRIGDVVSDVEVRSVVFRDGGILLSDCTSVPGWGTWRSYKEPIKRPERLTHECPVADTWERLEEDAANLDEMPCDYSAKDLVRRAKALAERDAS